MCDKVVNNVSAPQRAEQSFVLPILAFLSSCASLHMIPGQMMGLESTTTLYQLVLGVRVQ